MTGPDETTEPTGTTGWLPRPTEDLFGEGATAEEAYDLLTVDVPAGGWLDALTVARDDLGCTFFDWLSAVDEPGTGFRVCAHVVALPGPPPGRPSDTESGGGLRRLLLRTTVPHEEPTLPTATGVHAGAAWHERETHEMFGIVFAGHPDLAPLLLPDSFEGHPLRKDFVLAARVVKAWPGAKEPGESGHGGPKRRQMLPPGVPDPNEWGPLKGQLPPAPTRERPRRARGADGPRRTRTASGGSASQAGDSAAQTPRGPEGPEGSEAPQSPDAGGAVPQAGEETPRTPRRMRSAGGGSASQRAAGGGASARPRRMRSASGGSASQRGPAPADEPSGPAGEPSAAAGGPSGTGSAKEPPRSTDAPWHHARPAHGDDAPAGEAPDKEAPDREADKEAPAEESSAGEAPAGENRAEPAPGPGASQDDDGRGGDD
ncbi:NADH-quinone oxidoreductase subunit C [Streptomyces cacaoi]|uniref:NADH-quinone oxidoreductase subunit C n=1 Tax=Streptomyces cacaoi TaxID=1898 RepID=UPI0011F2B9A1|nr:NADH-quinone oxidoreductase subunit C [Streptomyces cacaoi]